MVFGLKPVCDKCGTKETNLWHRDEQEAIVCSACQAGAACPQPRAPPRTPRGRDEDDQEGARDEDKADQDDHKDADSSNGNGGKDDDQDGDKDKESGRSSDKRETKRRTRKGRQGGKGGVPKGKGRRYIFKKSATKAPAAVATPVTSEYLFCKGLYYQIGDIVSLIDVDGGTYYAQIRGLLQDQYCEKSAVLTWLLPTKASPPPEQGFDPSTYIIGPEEDIPRKLEYMEFERHAPSDYFKDRTSPYSTMTYQPQSCFVWSRLGPQIKPIEKAKELMTK